MDERTEHAEYPQHAEDVEHHVRHRRPSCLGVGGECCHIRGNRGTDILTHHKRNTLIDRQYASGAENHRNRHDGCRTLHAHGQDTTDEQEGDGGLETVGIETCKEIENWLVMSQIHVDAGLAKRTQAQEHKGYTEDEVADNLALLTIDEDDGDEERRPYKIRDVERETRTHDPGGERGSNVGAHDDGNRLGKGKETGIDE